MVCAYAYLCVHTQMIIVSHARAYPCSCCVNISKSTAETLFPTFDGAKYQLTWVLTKYLIKYFIYVTC